MKTSMKLIPCLIQVFLLSSVLQAQWWTSTQPLIPSQDNCTNLSLCGGFFVWEHQVDSATTAIYSQSIGSGSEPICLLFTSGVKYMKPCIYTGWPNNLFFFEANPNGNTDIYLIMVDQSGIPIDEIQPLVATSSNDHSVQYIYNMWPEKLVWLEEETIKVANINQNNYHFTISDIVTIDSLNCSFPSVFEGYNALYWIKHLESFDVIRLSTPTESGWSEPVNIDTAHQITMLRSTIYYYQLLQWTFKEDTSWFMNDYFPDYSDPFHIIPNIEQDHPFDFDVCDIGYGVKGHDAVDGNFFQAYVGYYEGFNEVLLNYEGDIDNYFNFSDLNANCRNPQFFIGEIVFPSTFYFYLTWEAYVDNSWQIYYSKMPITWGNISENETSPVSKIKVNPNPFSDRFDISFDLEKSMPVTVDLLDVHGTIMMNLVSETCTEGSFSRTYDMTGFPGQGGLYFIRFGVDGKYFFEKVVKWR